MRWSVMWQLFFVPTASTKQFYGPELLTSLHCVTTKCMPNFCKCLLKCLLNSWISQLCFMCNMRIYVHSQNCMAWPEENCRRMITGWTGLCQKHIYLGGFVTSFTQCGKKNRLTKKEIIQLYKFTREKQHMGSWILAHKAFFNIFSNNYRVPKLLSIWFQIMK